MIAARCPRLGDMCRALLRRREAVRGAPFDRFPVNSAVAVAIGLKHDASAVRRPDGKAIAPSERHTLSRHPALEPVHIDIGLFTVVDAEREPCAVGRYSRVAVGRAWQVQPFNDTSAIDEREIVGLPHGRRWAGQVHERTCGRRAELRGARQKRIALGANRPGNRAPDALDDRDGFAFRFESRRVERNRKAQQRSDAQAAVTFRTSRHAPPVGPHLVG